MTKRWFDIVGAGALLVASAPLFALIALAIKLDSRGPVLFWQVRVGRGGRTFRMAKFRKMPVSLPSAGPLVTRRYDPRLTRMGRWLERAKLDELPQLLNVLRGDMSLVGPRPEVPRFVDLADGRWQTVLSVRPGLVGLSQLSYRNESERYPADCGDPEAYYRERILPQKLDIDVDYVHRASFAFDLRLLVAGAWIVLAGAITRAGLRECRVALAMLSLQVLLAYLTLIVACVFVLGHDWPTALNAGPLTLLALVLLVRLPAFYALGTHRRRPASLSHADWVRIGKSVALGTAFMFVAAPIVGVGLPRQVLVFDMLLLAVVLIGTSYATHQLALARTDPRWQLPVTAGALLVALGTLGSVSVLAGMVAAESGVPLAATAPMLLGAAFLGAATVRAYGFLRHAVRNSTAPRDARAGDAARLFAASLLGSVMIVAWDAALQTHLLTLPVLLADVAATSALMVLVHRLAQPRDVTVEAMPATRVLIVGITPGVESLIAWLEADRETTVRIVGILATDPHHPRAQTMHGVEVLGRLADLAPVLKARPVDVVGYVPSVLSRTSRRDLIRECHDHGVRLVELPIAKLLTGETVASTSASRPEWVSHASESRATHAAQSAG